MSTIILDYSANTHMNKKPLINRPISEIKIIATNNYLTQIILWNNIISYNQLK
jgi:hypothetical protein